VSAGGCHLPLTLTIILSIAFILIFLWMTVFFIVSNERVPHRSIERKVGICPHSQLIRETVHDII